MSDCEKIKALLPQYIENDCPEETASEIEIHLNTCPECRKEWEEMTTELPPLPISLPNTEQINPFKKIRRYNRIRNGIIISVIAAIIIAASIIITTRSNFKKGKLVYCQDNPIIVLEAIADSFANPDYASHLSLVLLTTDGNIFSKDNHYFEIYDEDKEQYYQVCDEEIGSFHNICVRITPVSKKETMSDVFSLETTVNILKSVLEKEDIDENKMSITLYARRNVLDCNAEYYYNAISNTFTDAADFSKNCVDKKLCLIQLMEPVLEPPAEGVLTIPDLKVVNIAVIY